MSTLDLVFNVTGGSGGTVTLALSGGTITSIDWDDGTINTSLSHTYAADGTYNVSVAGTGVTNFNGVTAGVSYFTGCTSFGGIGLTDLELAFTDGNYGSASNFTTAPSSLPSTITNTRAMFFGATSFNDSSISSWNTVNVINMDGMFNNSAFNQNISGWNVSNVTNMAYMFYSDTVHPFNQNIGSWTVSSVTRMDHMFQNATSFNQDISSWDVSDVAQMDNMLDGTALSITNYNALLISWAAQTVQSGVTLGALDLIYTQPALSAHDTLTTTKGWTIIGDFYEPPPPPIVCFLEGSKILTDKGYKPIQDLRKGDLVKTIKHEYVPIDMIGKRDIYHIASTERIKDQLYKCSKDQYPELTEDLIITGCHSILVDKFTSEEQREKTIQVNGDTYVTDRKYRLPACADDRTSVYEVPGTYTIYHLALENDDYYMNYGIYANGLLVETCSKRYLKELSNMELF
jgi:surface protein